MVKFLFFQEWSDKWLNVSFFPYHPLYLTLFLLFIRLTNFFSALPLPSLSLLYIPSCNILFLSEFLLYYFVIFSLNPTSNSYLLWKITRSSLILPFFGFPWVLPAEPLREWWPHGWHEVNKISPFPSSKLFPYIWGSETRWWKTVERGKERRERECHQDQKKLFWK